MPVRALAGAESRYAKLPRPMKAEVATDVSLVTIDGAEHRLPAENPKAVTHALIAFAKRSGGGDWRQCD